METFVGAVATTHRTVDQDDEGRHLTTDLGDIFITISN